jgi:hypothetical protein
MLETYRMSHMRIPHGSYEAAGHGWHTRFLCQLTGFAVQGGIYHGRILLPSEYPFKPPSFLMLTPNGRFETGVKVSSQQ